MKNQAVIKTAIHNEPRTSEHFEKWVLCLYVAGQTKKSNAAYKNLKSICDEKLYGHYEIQVIDLLTDPQLARDNQILAVPTLVRKMPLPIRNIIGDLSNRQSVLVGLDLVEINSLYSK